VAAGPQSADRASAISEEVSFSNGDVVLSGTLTKPSSGQPFPVVILVSGSGAHDRDGFQPAIPDYRPFFTIAEHLAGRKFAVLRYDDRGVGRSTGDYISAEEEDFVGDLEAALDYLRSRSDVDGDHIGLIGHSEGSLIAALTAGKNKNVALVISLAGGAVEGFDLLISQAENQARANGMSEEEIAQVIQEQSQIFDLARDRDWDGLTELVTEVTLKRLKALPKERVAGLGDLEAFASRRAVQSMQAFQHPRYQFILNHDFGKDWEHVSVPILAIFGELDVQVDAVQNAEAIKLVCGKYGNPDITTVILPEANHLFIPARTGGMNEYVALPKSFVPDLLPAITQWLEQRIMVN